MTGGSGGGQSIGVCVPTAMNTPSAPGEGVALIVAGGGVTIVSESRVTVRRRRVRLRPLQNRGYTTEKHSVRRPGARLVTAAAGIMSVATRRIGAPAAAAREPRRGHRRSRYRSPGRRVGAFGESKEADGCGGGLAVLAADPDTVPVRFERGCNADVMRLPRPRSRCAGASRFSSVATRRGMT